MKKTILSAFGLLAAYATAMAQNPTEMTFTVEYTTAEGGNGTITVDAINKNSFGFIGGQGEVQNPVTGETITEENRDLYGWVSDLNYNAATFNMQLGSEVDEEDVQAFGVCVSENPSPAEAYEGAEPQRATEQDYFYTPLSDLGYMTTYYVRPYVTFANGYTMYGGEKSFTTPRTIEGALLNESDLAGWQYYDANTGVVLTKEAMLALAGYAEEPEQNVKAGMAQDLGVFLENDETIPNRLKELASRTIECTDGTLYAVKEVPADVASAFEAYFNGEAAFSPQPDDVNRDDYGYYTRNVGEITTVECEESWGVPSNSYMECQPATAADPNICINIPKYLQPRTYALYATFVHPDIENDPRGYRFRTSIWEQTEQEDGSSSYSSQRLTPPEEGASLSDGSNFMTDPSKQVDTLFLGNYTFNGAPNTMIQFQSYVQSRLFSTYSKTMRIAQIHFVPIEDESGTGE